MRCRGLTSRPRTLSTRVRRGPPCQLQGWYSGPTLAPYLGMTPFPLPRLLVVGGLLLALQGAAAAQAQPALPGYAVLGLDEVRLARGARVQPGAVGSTAGSVRLAPAVAVPGSVVADSVRGARSTRVGRLFCRLVSGGPFGPGTVGGPTVGGSPIPGCRALTTPVVDPALLAPVAVSAGASDLRVPARTGSAPIGPGAYAQVSVGKGSLLQLAGGDYQFRSIQLARAARLVCLEACRIGVAETVRMGPRAQLGAVQGLRPALVRLDVGGSVGVAFFASPRAIGAATILAPAGR